MVPDRTQLKHSLAHQVLKIQFSQTFKPRPKAVLFTPLTRHSNERYQEHRISSRNGATMTHAGRNESQEENIELGALEELVKSAIRAEGHPEEDAALISQVILLPSSQNLAS